MSPVWREPEATPISDALRAAVGGHPLVSAILSRRGLSDPDRALAYLEPARYTPTPADVLPDLPEAVVLLRAAIAEGERILIWGDFDVDGQTSTALLLEGLRGLGAEARYYVPHRREGHGLNLPGLERAIANGAQWVLTCDTGITAQREIEYCHSRGARVIITDHHDLPDPLPEAEAVINPKRLPPDHPLRDLSGAGVAYKLLEALQAAMGCPERSADALDLVALGLVADVSPMTGEARYLVQRGLVALRRTNRLGIRALCEAAELSQVGLDEEHIGYMLAPRLNALGRLDDASVAVELLTTSDWVQAQAIAGAIEGVNNQRKFAVKQIMDAIQEQIARDPALLREAALVFAQRHWPSGVVGIVAGRLAERYALPAVVIAIGEEGVASGSARSVPGCDIHAAIAAQAEILRRFGGHPMAAGCSLDADLIPEFRARLLHTIRQMGCHYEPELLVDAEVHLEEATLGLAGELRRLAPFGPGNPPPCLVLRNLSLTSSALIGRTQEHRRLTVSDAEGRAGVVLQWHGAELPLPQGRFDLAFALRASDFQGRAEAQLEWLDARELEPAPVAATAPAIAALDWRGEMDAEAALNRLRQLEPALALWAEGAAAPAGSADRRRLEPSPALAIYTIPPGPQELQAAIRQVAPQRVYLLAVDPGMDANGEFLKRLAGLVKYVLSNRAGAVECSALAAATAQRASVIRAGLRWLAAKGQIAAPGQGEALRLTPGDGQTSPDLAAADKLLRALLAETAAYRKSYLHAPAEALVNAL
jgi:single-stranded-DNA-specific exonuclease